MSDCTDPHLGLATTKQLIDELATRAEVASVIGEQWPASISSVESYKRTWSLPLTDVGTTVPEELCDCAHGPTLGSCYLWAWPRCGVCRKMAYPDINPNYKE